MQFTRLRLNGFKSFVDPTDLVISSGLTGVVGPNGCGKSNLLEALRWIMGENRAKQMRGDGMEDVIFAGTDSRPTRSSASVELVIDNSDRLAPAAFNQDPKLEISRRITRDVGSAYKINGKDVRARDVQMLFADASTGAHSPALVRQGQIAELINAKPKARRRILEEAAGISGLYQRRHEAELKLKGTETNLARVEDVLDQLGQRLSSLERQAGQARRYRKIAEELRRTEAVLLYLRWRMAETERAKADADLTAASRQAAEAEGRVLQATRARETADAALPPLREEETIASAVVQRMAIEREQIDEREDRARREIEQLAARARQMAQDIEREETLQRDAGGALEKLTEEQGDLRSAQDAQQDTQAEAVEAARIAGEALTEQETNLDRLTEEAARLAARAAAAERRLEEARSVVARLDRDIAQTEAAHDAMAGQIVTAEATLEQAFSDVEQTRAEAQAAEQALEAAEKARSGAQETEGEARAALSDSEGEVKALSAEIAALERLLARDGGSQDKLIDQVHVDPGFEAALGAALGEDLNASDVTGQDGSGWTLLDPLPAPAALPPGVRPCSDIAKGPSLLDRRLSQTGVVEQANGDAIQSLLLPGQRIVSAEGDLWRWDGLRVRAGESSSTAALRLQQRNRLERLKTSLDRAKALREKASDAHQTARSSLVGANEAEASARSARRNADQAVAEAARQHSKAEADIGMLRAKLTSQTEALAARQNERQDAGAALSEAQAGLSDLGDVDAARRSVEVQRGEVDLARTAMLSARAQADEIRRAGTARDRRLTEIGRELEVWRDRQSNAHDRIAELSQRMQDTTARQAEIATIPDELAERKAKLSSEIDAAEDRRKTSADALAAGEAALRDAEAQEREAEKAASARREERARQEAVLEGLAQRVAEADAEIRSELDLEPGHLLETLGAEPQDLPVLDAAEADAAKLRRQRDALGAVNLRAEEDANEVREERDSLAKEKQDLDEAIAQLRKGISELNREGRQRLIAAFESVNKRFSNLFTHLFGGGEARLVLVESDDPLDAGLEIMCQPPGKKLSTLSLLSGGEQTLTALSLIFAVFLSNPAPICVLDEVDAPLDDSNVTRFCDLLDEMRRLTETRFLIITHHAITMSRMDRLFGVTMVERGVSQLVSVDLVRAAELVDA
ncbi:MAG: chromosome segregation protein SMC [Pseudomonadota bacterium]